MFRGAEAAAAFGIAPALSMRLREFGRGNALFRSAKEEAGSWEALRSEFSMRLPVLLYHHVGQPSVGTDPEFSVSRADFERQMDWLANRNYTTITPPPCLDAAPPGKPLTA